MSHALSMWCGCTVSIRIGDRTLGPLPVGDEIAHVLVADFAVWLKRQFPGLLSSAPYTVFYAREDSLGRVVPTKRVLPGDPDIEVWFARSCHYILKPELELKRKHDSHATEAKAKASAKASAVGGAAAASVHSDDDEEDSEVDVGDQRIVCTLADLFCCADADMVSDPQPRVDRVVRLLEAPWRFVCV